MSSPFLPPFTPPWRPLNNITPFTIRDGITYLEKLENIAADLNVVVDFVNENFGSLDESIASSISTLVDAVNANIAAVNEATSSAIENNQEEVDAKLLAFTTSTQALVDELDANIATQNANVASAIAGALATVQEQVDSIVNESVTVQDAVVYGIVNDSNSQTRGLMDELFLGEAANDVAVSNNVLNPASATRIALDANFASQAIETIVTTGRLSEADLEALIIALANGRIAAINRDDFVLEAVSDSGSDTRAALSLLYAPRVAEPRWKAWRPDIIQALQTGVGGVNEGRYYFDGVAIHFELLFQASSTNAGPVGSNPIMGLPSDSDVIPGLSTTFDAIGKGQLHNAANGSIHEATAVRSSTGSDRFAINYQSGTQLVAVTSAAPFAWGVLSGFALRGWYIPKVKSEPKNYLAYGDSITRFDSNGIGLNTGTWPIYVRQEGLAFGGGYAIDSGTSAQILAGAKKLNALAAVCMVGVNDIAQSVPLATTVANVLALKNKVQADRFILCKIAPYNANTTAAAAMNAAYETLAANNGMVIIDPFGAYRQGNGQWTAGASSDGVHPTTAVSQAAALVIRNAILAL